MSHTEALSCLGGRPVSSRLGGFSEARPVMYPEPDTTQADDVDVAQGFVHFQNPQKARAVGELLLCQLPRGHTLLPSQPPPSSKPWLALRVERTK